MELIDLVNSAQISSNLNFPSWIPDSDVHSSAHLDLFLSSHPSICSTMVFHPLGNTDNVFLSVSIDFPSKSERDTKFYCIAFDYSRADVCCFSYIERFFVCMWKKNFMAPFYGWHSTASRLESHFKEAVYFLPLSSHKFLLFILLTSEGWKAESTLERAIQWLWT